MTRSNSERSCARGRFLTLHISGVPKGRPQIAVGVSPRKNSQNSWESREAAAAIQHERMLSLLRGFVVFRDSHLRADARSYVLSPLRGF